MIHLPPITDAEFWALWDALDRPSEEDLTDIEEHNPELAGILRKLQSVCP